MRMVKRIGIVIGVLALLAAAVVTFLTVRSPRSRPASTEKLAATPERLARGAYLVEHVSACVDCHSERDWTQFAAPVKAERAGGGFCFPKIPGVLDIVLCPSNITPSPHGVASWSDGELMRAIREGVDKDGQALFPMMPYGSYRAMSEDDVRAVVAYLRTLRPVDTEVPRTVAGFPLNLLIKNAPQPLEGPVSAPPATDHVAYGKYLVTIAGCADCHTPRVKGKSDPERAFAGGNEFAFDKLRVVSANITPDEQTGIGRMTRDAFIGRFRSYASLGNAPVTPEHQTLMPWRLYGGMTEEDLGAIYDYLRTVRPLANKVVMFPNATL